MDFKPGATMNLTLYVDSQFTSPYAMSAFVTLKEKGLPFELVTVDLEAGENHAQAYSALALTSRVPALVHGDFVLTESSAISEYLDEVFPAPEYHAILPRNSQRRAQARQIQAWLRSDLMPIRQERSTITVFYQPATVPLSPAARSAADQLIRAASKLVNGPNLFTRWCIADTDLAVMLQRLIKSGDDVPPALRDYAAAQWQRDSVQAWLKLLPKI
jgi:glutathione S-transferase